VDSGSAADRTKTSARVRHFSSPRPRQICRVWCLPENAYVIKVLQRL
jgi:hypothetical protein